MYRCVTGACGYEWVNLVSTNKRKQLAVGEEHITLKLPKPVTRDKC